MFQDIQIPRRHIVWHQHLDMVGSSLWTEVRKENNEEFQTTLSYIGSRLQESEEEQERSIGEFMQHAICQAMEDKVAGEGTSHHLYVTIGEHMLSIYANCGDWRIGCMDATRDYPHVLDYLKEYFESQEV